MKKIYADLHIHIGRTYTGRAVKITGAKTLTLDRILVEASEYKGIELLGIIDCHSPEVIIELEEGIASGRYHELEGGGVRYRSTTLLLGSELEIYDEACSGPIHVLAFMPTLADMTIFSLAFRTDEKYSLKFTADIRNRLESSKKSKRNGRIVYPRPYFHAPQKLVRKRR